MAPQAKATLVQRKLFTAVTDPTPFYVEEFIKPGAAQLQYPFKVTPFGVTEQMEVATFIEVFDWIKALPVNRLTRFRAETSLASVSIGMNLRVTLPDFWRVIFPGKTYLDFTLSQVATLAAPNEIVVNVPFPCLTSNLVWQIRDVTNASVVMTGSLGQTLRRYDMTTPYRDGYFVTGYANPSDALTRIQATQALFSTLVRQASFSASQYLNAPPGNPIENTYEE